MSRINATFLTENRLGVDIPEQWVAYVCELAQEELWKHHFLWEAYQVLELLDTTQIQDQRILEPGCGNGVVACMLTLMGADVTLLDYSDVELSKARRYARELGVEQNIDFVEADLFSPPLPKHSYDLVWNDGVVEHFEDPIAVIRVMSMMTRPGGHVLVTVPGKWTLNTLFIRRWRRWRKSYPFDRWGREKSFSETQLKRMMLQAGLQDVRTSTHHLRRALLDDYFLTPLLQGRDGVKPGARSLINLIDALEDRVPLLDKFGFIVAAIGRRGKVTEKDTH